MIDECELLLLRAREWVAARSLAERVGISLILALILGIARHFGLLPERHPHVSQPYRDLRSGHQ